jgi:preprotein translocase SecE subunit
VARDRQRAKQRRRRSAGTGGPTAGSARTRARDKAARQPPEAPPEPTENAFPNVDEARMAEAGVPLEPARDEREPAFDELEPTQDEVEPAPDELEPVGDYPTDPAVAEERAEAARPRRKRGKVLTFLGHVVDELRRVQWPDRRQTGQGTAVTLGFVVIAGGFLGLMDAIWKPIVEAIL